MRNHVEAERTLGILPGGTASLLVRCDDCRHYILKSRHNAQGPNVLANEMIGTQLMRAVALPVAPWRIVDIDGQASSSGGGALDSPSHGKPRDLGFASRLLISWSGRRSGVQSSDGFISRISNRSDFVGALVFDVWAGSTDVRQVVYIDRGPHQVRALFIDQGHLFGGPNWDFNGRSGDCFHRDRRVYDDPIDQNLIDGWIAKVTDVVGKRLSAVLAQVPRQWYSGDIGLLRATLDRRLASLPSLVWNELAVERTSDYRRATAAES